MKNTLKTKHLLLAEVDDSEINPDSNENDNKNYLENTNSYIINDDDVKTDITVDCKLEFKTNIKVDLMWNEEYDNIEIINENLIVNDKAFSINDDRIQYFCVQRYQRHISIVFYHLTEKGNISVTEFSSERAIDSFNDFIQLNYSNVQNK